MFPSHKKKLFYENLKISTFLKMIIELVSLGSLKLSFQSVAKLRVINLSAFFCLWCTHPRTLASPPLFRVFVVLFIRSITAIIIVKTREKMDQIRAVDQSRVAL